MRRPIIYIFLNKSLHMTAGKIAAQAAHAAVVSVINSTQEARNTWEDSIHKTIICLEARDENHLKNAKEYLAQRQYNMISIIDEGANEVAPQSWTSMASQILDKDNENVEKAFSSFRLYRDPIRFTMEVDR